MPPRRAETAVLAPHLGLVLDRPSLAIEKEGLESGLNFRISDKSISNLNLGWAQFGDFTLNGPVVLIDNFFLRSGTEKLIFATPTDLYDYNETTETLVFITPRYETGTVEVSGATPAVVTGTGTSWSSNLKAGDEISFGASGDTDPDSTWYIIDTVDSDTQLTLTTAVTGAPLGAGTAYTARILFSGSISNTWRTAQFQDAQPDDEDKWYASNGIDDMVAWNGTDDQVELLSALGITAVKALAVYKNTLIYGNFTQSGEANPSDIANSDVANPEDLSSGLASQFTIHDGPDEILDMIPLGDYLVIYCERHIIMVQFVGDPEVFIFRNAHTGIGPLSFNVTMDFGYYHEFLGPDCQYRFDGVSARRVNSHVWKDILGSRDAERMPFAFGHLDEENGEVVWAIPLANDDGAGDSTAPPEFAYTEHYLEVDEDEETVPHSKREFPFVSTGYSERQSGLTWDAISDTWDELNFRWDDQFFTASFPLNLGGAEDGKVYTLNTAQSADGAALATTVLFPKRALGDGRMRGLLRRVYPFMQPFPTASYNVNVAVKFSDHASGSASITDTQTFSPTLAEGAHFTSHFRRGRFFQVEFSTTDANEPWILDGYDIDVSVGGRR